MKGLTLVRRQFLSGGTLSNQTWEFDANSSEYEFDDDGYEEFWISSDAIVGNSTRLANGDITGSTGAKRDLLVNGSMPVDCKPWDGNFPVLTQPSTPVPSGEYRAPAEDLIHGFMYTQIIKVYDNTAPVVTGLRDTFCIREGADCLADMDITVKGTDNCSNEVTLETQFLMIAPGQTTDASKMILFPGQTGQPKIWAMVNSRSRLQGLPVGTHDLMVVGRDECGNLSKATRIPFVVADCKGPAPICINGLSTELMPDGNGGGMMAVWASDFVASKIYDCNGQGTETKDGLKLVTKYSINRVGEPVIATKPVSIWIVMTLVHQYWLNCTHGMSKATTTSVSLSSKYRTTARCVRQSILLQVKSVV
nr:hypothetical protein [Haliscomenobacter sp.]